MYFKKAGTAYITIKAAETKNYAYTSKDIKVTMEYYIDVDVEFQKSENETVINYLMDKDIFGIDFNKEVKTA